VEIQRLKFGRNDAVDGYTADLECGGSATALRREDATPKGRPQQERAGRARAPTKAREERARWQGSQRYIGLFDASLERGTGGDLADFGVFDDTAAESFDGGLQHGAADIVAVDIETRKRLEEPAQRLDQRVDFRKAG